MTAVLSLPQHVIYARQEQNASYRQLFLSKEVKHTSSNTSGFCYQSYIVEYIPRSKCMHKMSCELYDYDQIDIKTYWLHLSFDLSW